MRMSPGSVRFSLLPALLAVALLSGGGLEANASNYQLNQPIPEVRLKDGTILRAVTFASVGTASITGRWDGGRGSIPLTLLPEDIRAALVGAAPQPPTTATPLGASPHAAPPTAAGAPSAAAVNATKLPTEIKLTNGFVMRGAKVVGWRANAMTVEYVGGKVLVQLDDVAPEQRMIFVARKIAMLEERDRAAAARAGQAAGQVGPAQGISASALRELIRTGISTHQIVIGMTQQEVGQSMGTPDGVKSDADAPHFTYWLFRGKGRDANGAPCDRIVGFDKGIVDGWKDGTFP